MRAWCALAVALSLFSPAEAGVAYVPVANIHPGDRGRGLATFAQTTVGEYDVEVLDVLRSDGTTADALLVRVSGSQIERAGGIAAGMSGSPIYIGGELAAALSYALPDADPHYGYATPAEYVAPLLERGAAAAGLITRPFAGPGAMAARSGQDLVGALFSSAVTQAPGPEPAGLAPIQPGSAVGIQLARGAINVTTIGTVTAVSGDRLLAFGHKYLHEGTCDYPLVRVSIGGIVPSGRVPFMLGNPVGDPVGVVTEDRAAGCVADLGRRASMAPVSVSVADERGVSRELRLDLVRTPEVFFETLASTVIAAADGVLDRVGPGSAEVGVTLACTGGYLISRSDVISSERDIGGSIAAEIRHWVREIVFNASCELTPERCDVTVKASASLARARIASCEVAPARAAPGNAVLVTVTLRPYRSPAATVQARLRVPPDAAPGLLRVRVHGKAADELGLFDPWEQEPVFDVPAAYCEWISRAGKGRSVACDLLRSPLERLLRSVRSSVPAFDESGEMGTRDVPGRESARQPSGMAALLGSGDVLARETVDTAWEVTGESYADLEVVR